MSVIEAQLNDRRPQAAVMALITLAATLCAKETRNVSLRT